MTEYGSVSMLKKNLERLDVYKSKNDFKSREAVIVFLLSIGESYSKEILSEMVNQTSVTSSMPQSDWDNLAERKEIVHREMVNAEREKGEPEPLPEPIKSIRTPSIPSPELSRAKIIEQIEEERLVRLEADNKRKEAIISRFKDVNIDVRSLSDDVLKACLYFKRCRACLRIVERGYINRNFCPLCRVVVGKFARDSREKYREFLKTEEYKRLENAVPYPLPRNASIKAEARLRRGKSKK